ncbi:hypothetical protein L9F63_017281 [Diploptera punctata]|uniref:Odorant-binding protein n=1 Tax=Diploptera punctata TaxID=6984 RepID=A0AAD8A0F0_DIPPU|nr:hypothetical protein L9F63_017281 [Diploptera punctata]
MEFYALLVLLSAVSADNFQPVNFVYEHTIEKQFLKSTLNRTRREGDEIPNCCGRKKIGFDHITKDIVNCKGYFKNDEENLDLYCAGLCLAKSIGIVNEDGEIDDSKLKEFLEGSFPEELEEVVDSAVEKCVDEADKMSPKNCGSKCDTLPVYAFSCALDNIIENCPKEHIVHGNEAACSNLREYLQYFSSRCHT